MSLASMSSASAMSWRVAHRLYRSGAALAARFSSSPEMRTANSAGVTAFSGIVAGGSAAETGTSLGVEK
jgi:hypothetical protein